MSSRTAALPPHLSGTAVSAAADSELSTPERARVLSHLSRCTACRGRLVTEMATKDLVHSLGLGAPVPPSDLTRSLLSLGEPSPRVAAHPSGHGGPARTPLRASRLGGSRLGAVGVLSAVGLGIGLAAAAVVPVDPGATQSPASTQQAGVQQAGVPPPVTGQPVAAAGHSTTSATRASGVLPAAFATDGGPVAAVRGTAPVTVSVAQDGATTDAAAGPVVRRAALLVVVQVLMSRLGAVGGR